MLVDGSLNPPPTPSLYPHPQHITTPPPNSAVCRLCLCCQTPLRAGTAPSVAGKGEVPGSRCGAVVILAQTSSSQMAWALEFVGCR